MKVFVKNNSQYKSSYTGFVTNEGDTGVAVSTQFTATFGVFAKESATGMVTSTGFTEIEEEQYEALLASSKLFASAVKRGNLVMYRDPPPEALTDSRLLAKAESQVIQLKAKVVDLEKQLTTGGLKDNAAELEEAINKLTEENAALKDRLENTKVPQPENETLTALIKKLKDENKDLKKKLKIVENTEGL